MANTETLQTFTHQSGTDMTADQFKFVTIDTTSGLARLCDADDIVAGILQNKPNVGQAAEIGFSGVSKIVTNAGLSNDAGDILSSNALGLSTTAVGLTEGVGIALEASATVSKTITMLLKRIND